MAMLVAQDRGKPPHDAMLTGVGHQNPQINTGPIEPTIKRLSGNRGLGADPHHVDKCAVRGENLTVQVRSHDGLRRILCNRRQRWLLVGTRRPAIRSGGVTDNRRDANHRKRESILAKWGCIDQQCRAIQAVNLRLIRTTTRSDAGK